VSGRIRSKNLEHPDESVTFDHGHMDLVTLGELTVGRTVARPGWRWSTHIRPVVGGDWCENRHVGVVVSGRLGVTMEDGSSFEFEPNDVFDIAPRHDGYVIGDEPAVTIEWSGVRGWVEPLESLTDRILATLVITDIVDSTGTAERIGQGRWNELLGRHIERMREVLGQFRGREVKTTGDGLMAISDGAARGIRCAARMVAVAPEDGLEIRAAVHTGEVEVLERDLLGVTVHEAVRVLGVAQPGEVLVTEITRGLAGDSGVRFADRGEHVLRGIEGPRRLFAVELR
jgi:class 3 adenylate cyclase